jgi:hypothetical protein
MSELSLWLDSYDDIYSNFDSRNYLRRRISDDFLHELHNALKYKKERVNDMLLLLPQESRSETNEQIIVDSLQDFFKQQYSYMADKCRKKLYNGLWLIVTGFLIMSINLFIGYKMVATTLPLIALKVLLEPAGWFLIWAAFDFLFYGYKDLLKEKRFYSELAEMKIHFRSS